jgi:hypothetical protein
MKVHKSADDPLDKGGDVMRGCDAIAKFINDELSEEPVTRKQVQGWISKGFIPAGKLGSQIVASKHAIRARFAQLVGGERFL